MATLASMFPPIAGSKTTRFNMLSRMEAATTTRNANKTKNQYSDRVARPLKVAYFD
jgi:hypothetical protein